MHWQTITLDGNSRAMLEEASLSVSKLGYVGCVVIITDKKFKNSMISTLISTHNLRAKYEIIIPSKHVIEFQCFKCIL